MLCVGIDLGGTNIAAGVVDERGSILGRARLKTHPPRPDAEICDDMVAAARKAVEDAGCLWDDIAWVGVGAPGTVNVGTGVVEYSNNLNQHHFAIRAMMFERTGKPIFIDNDANVAAYGEYIAGAARGSRSSVTVTLGTGVGSGILIDKRIYSGANYAGAELGHQVIVEGGHPCTCGRLGCWEAYASIPALIELTRAVMAENPDSFMWEITGHDIGKAGGRTAFAAMRAGDEMGGMVVERYLRYVGCGIVNIINIFQPEILCIGGGISREGEALIAPLRRMAQAERFSRYAERQTEIVAAKLAGDAGLIGAALLGFVREYGGR